MKSKLFQQILEETPLEAKIFVDKYSDLILRINQILKEKGISQKELAESIDKKPSEISRWLSVRAFCSSIDYKILSFLFTISSNCLLSFEICSI